MAKLSLYEVNQAQLEQIPKIDGQLIVISDTGSIYRDIVVNGVVNRILIGNDIIAVDELPLAPISNKIYYLKPNKLYTYNSGWVDLTDCSVKVEDVEGLLEEQKIITSKAIWKYSDDISMDLDVGGLHLYFISDDTNPNNLLGNVVTLTSGETFTIEADNIMMTLDGVYNIKYPVGGDDYILVLTSDFDPTIVGVSEFICGTYAARPNGQGTESIVGQVEITKNTISSNLLPFGESGFKIEWDGTLDETSLDFSTTLGIYFHKVGESLIKEELIGATFYQIINGEIISCTVNNNVIVDFNDKCFAIMGADGTLYGFVTSEATEVDLSALVGEEFNLLVPSEGLWFPKADDDNYTYKLIGSDYQLIQLDPKYIPANLDFDLSDYYTKIEVDDAFNNMNDNVNEVLDEANARLDEANARLDEVDNLVGDANAVLDEISGLIGE